MSYELAGLAGVSDLGPLTLRKLVWMAKSRQEDAWNQTAALLAMIYNMHRSADAPFKTPADFLGKGGTNRSAPPPTEADLEILRQAFPGNRRKRKQP